MKARNKKGVVAETLLIYVVVGVILLFVPNPVSTFTGIGVRPNKTVQSERVELLLDKKGNPVKAEDGTYLVKRSIKDTDQQQKPSFWEWLSSLPIIALLLMGLGTVFPPIAIILARFWLNLKRDTKKIVVGVDKALSKVKDDELLKQMKLEMGNVQDSSTKKLVDKIQGK